MATNEKAYLSIWELYCQTHNIEPAVKTTNYDKVDRQRVDDKSFEDRIKDDDPLFIGE